jgi:HEAT repeat protein
MLGRAMGTEERFAELTSPTLEDDDERGVALRALAREDSEGFSQVALGLSLRDELDTDRLGYAIEALVEEPEGFRELLLALLDRLIKATQDPAARFHAGACLGEFDALDAAAGEGVRARLTAALGDVDPYVRRFCAQTLGNMLEPGDADAIAALMRLLAADHDWRVRARAAEALLWIDDELPDDALRTIADAIRSDGDWRVRAHTCAHVIGAAAVERLGSALDHAQQDPDRRVRLAAARALREGGRGGRVGIGDRFAGLLGGAPAKDLVAADEDRERGSG